MVLRPKLVLLLTDALQSYLSAFASACLRDTASFILPQYWKSRGTSHCTTLFFFFVVWVVLKPSEGDASAFPFPFWLLNAIEIFVEEQTWLFLTLNWRRIKGFISFPRDISPKVNVITQLKFELANFEAAVQQFNYYVMRTHLTSRIFIHYAIKQRNQTRRLVEIFKGGVF